MTKPLKSAVDLENWYPSDVGVVGMDPGANGCLAFLYLDTQLPEEGEAPGREEEPRLEGVYWRVDSFSVIRDAIPRIQSHVAWAWMEKLHGRNYGGKKGRVKSATTLFNQGENYGRLQGWVDGKIPYSLVTPQKWQKQLPEAVPSGLSYEDRKKWLTEKARIWVPNLGPYMPAWAADAVVMALALREQLRRG